MGKSKRKRFAMIKNKVQNAKNNILQARPNRSSLTNFNKSSNLLQGKEYSRITHEEELKRIKNIRNNIKKIIDKKS